jgi:shikimate 5-dehydrogenase
VSAERLEHARHIHQQLKSDIQFEYVINADPKVNDDLMSALPAGSVVINGTGMGKYLPGSPITDAGIFPQEGLVWEFNYRGELTFLHQAQQQADHRPLTIEDGWVYFLHGWTQVLAEVLNFELTPELFDKLDAAARDFR